MTERLYYTQPAVREFDATVVAASEHDGSPAVVLDRTAFYPTSGGQPHDTGRLNTAAVLDVVDGEGGAVIHVLDHAISEGTAVRGSIDWERRFDHMQQHSGQHLLSAAFERVCGAKTVGFHLGAELSTIDLDRVLSIDQVVAAERDATRVVWEDRPIAIRLATDEEAAALPLRKDPGRVGRLRLIEVPGYDLSACGGTHVASTGAIGHVQVWTAEKFRGGLRVEFVCGGRALRAYRTLRDSLSGSIRYLSVLPDELPGAIERLQAESKALRKAIKSFQERLAVFEAAGLAARAVAAGGIRHVVEALDGWDQNGLKALAAGVIRQPGFAVALFSTSAPHAAVIGRSAGVPLDAAAVLTSLTARFGGRGGGKADLAQGGGLEGPLPALLDAARVAFGLSA
jgi:alanyl-tRNA synthetase